MPDLHEKIVAWLKDQPQDGQVVWHSDDLDPDVPWTTGWVDVLCQDLQEVVGCNWVWTIEEPAVRLEEDPEPNPETIEWATDLALWIVAGPTYEDGWQHVVPIDKERFLPNKAEAESLTNEQTPGTCVIGGRAWSAEAISAALHHWAGYHAERPDLTFVWNPDGPPSSMLQTALSIIEDPDAEFFLVKPGEDEGGDGLSIRASEPVMDMFLDMDPEDAAAVMDALQQHIDDRFPPTDTKDTEDDHD